MPLTVQCGGCGKQLKVKDEFVGRRIKCPQCGQTFMATAQGAATGPAAVRAPKAPKAAGTPRFHVSPGIILLVCAGVGIPLLFFLYRIGPGHVSEQLAAQEDGMKGEIGDVVDRILQSYLSQRGGYDPLKSHATPHTLDVTLLPAPMYMSMPSSIGFVGITSQGAFHGQYHLQTHEVEAHVEVGGMSLPSGVLVRHGSTVLNGTGRVKNGGISAEIDGSPAELAPPSKEPE